MHICGARTGAAGTNSYMQVVTVDWPAADVRPDWRTDLEEGNILFLPAAPFDFPVESRDFLRSLSFAGSSVHKNIAYKPAVDRVTGIDASDERAAKLHDIMRSFSKGVVQFVSELLPEYAASWKLDYASFRPVEEEGRDLPLNKRNDLIHTDAFPTRPTNGDLILRVFTNIHPEKRRVWVTADPFGTIAPRFARDAGLDRIAADKSSLFGKLRDASTGALRSAGLPVVRRSAYDRFMLRFHKYLKLNSGFQNGSTHYEFVFPPGSTWLVFTDVVPHAVKSGQHAVEQTFIISRSSLANPARAPIAILEQLCGRKLAA